MFKKSDTKNRVRKKEKNALLQLLDFAGPRKKLAFLGCALSAINGIFTILPLVFVWFVVRDLIQVAPNWSEATSVSLWGWCAFGSALIGVILYFTALMCTHLVAFRVAANMRKKMLSHLSNVPMGYFNSNSTGHLRRVIDSCAGQTEEVLAHKLPDFVGSMVAPVAFLVVMFAFDWLLGLICLIPILVSGFSMWWMMGRNTPEGGRYFMEMYQNALNNMNGAATEYVRGIPVVKVFQQTVHSFKAFKGAILEYRDMATRYVKYCQLPQVIQLVAINSTFVLLVPAGIFLAAIAPDFASFLADYLFYVFFSMLTTIVMSKVMYSTEAVMMAEDSIRRVKEILAVKPIKEVQGTMAQAPRDVSIQFDAVSFKYPGSTGNALSQVSFSIDSGTTVALVGPSGGGKTTAASLIPRFWDPDEGVVLVGGVDVKSIPTEALMNTVSFVFQNDHLFKQSILDNIRAGRPEASLEEVEAAAHAAQCDDIIAKFPEGLNTVVGTKGVYLSGGECQRIALARAILKNAPIVVLDEATAFADPENEMLIQRALVELCKGKTVLMIAHRLSTVVGVDRIFVLSEGVLVEEGTHDNLLKQEGLYSDLWNDYLTSISWTIEREHPDVA